MTLPAEIRDLVPWAADGDRTDPETVGIDRANGWGVIYEQIGGRGPERAVWNQIVYEITQAIIEVRSYGLPLEWDAAVDYRHPAFVRGSDGAVYQSIRNSGPATGNAAAPTAAGQSVWEIH